MMMRYAYLDLVGSFADVELVGHDCCVLFVVLVFLELSIVIGVAMFSLELLYIYANKQLYRHARDGCAGTRACEHDVTRFDPAVLT
jgi:hypothetical protein